MGSYSFNICNKIILYAYPLEQILTKNYILPWKITT